MKFVLSREFLPPKPSPEPLLHICRAMSIKPTECIMVGDGADDLKSAHAAGMGSILLRNAENGDLIDSYHPTFVVDDLSEIINIVKDRTR